MKYALLLSLVAMWIVGCAGGGGALYPVMPVNYGQEEEFNPFSGGEPQFGNGIIAGPGGQTSSYFFAPGGGIITSPQGGTTLFLGQ